METQLTKNFTLGELTNSITAKKLGIKNIPNEKEYDNLKYLAEKVLQPLRDHFGSPINITVAFRCKKLNDAVGGSKTSFHVQAAAADIDNDNMKVSNKEIFEYIKDNLDFTELINEFNYSWIHVGILKGREKEKEVLEAKKVKGKTVYLLVK
jgi:hypothetical protein